MFKIDFLIKIFIKGRLILFLDVRFNTRQNSRLNKRFNKEPRRSILTFLKWKTFLIMSGRYVISSSQTIQAWSS